MITINSLENEPVKGLFIFIQNYASDIVRVVNSSQFCVSYYIVHKKRSVCIRVFLEKKNFGWKHKFQGFFFIENRKSSTPSIFFEGKKIKLRVKVK